MTGAVTATGNVYTQMLQSDKAAIATVSATVDGKDVAAKAKVEFVQYTKPPKKVDCSGLAALKGKNLLISGAGTVFELNSKGCEHLMDFGHVVIEKGAKMTHAKPYEPSKNCKPACKPTQVCAEETSTTGKCVDPKTLSYQIIDFKAKSLFIGPGSSIDVSGNGPAEWSTWLSNNQPQGGAGSHGGLSGLKCSGATCSAGGVYDNLYFPYVANKRAR